LFEIIAEGARRRLFTPDQLKEVMAVLCEPKKDAGLSRKIHQG